MVPKYAQHFLQKNDHHIGDTEANFENKTNELQFQDTIPCSRACLPVQHFFRTQVFERQMCLILDLFSFNFVTACHSSEYHDMHAYTKRFSILNLMKFHVVKGSAAKVVNRKRAYN